LKNVALAVVTIIGAFTAFFAATVALVASVVPCITESIVCGSQAAFWQAMRTTSMTPRTGSSPVVRVLAVYSELPLSSAMSVKVPPISTAMRF